MNVLLIAGDFSGAVDTLKTAISLIKQSITATAESSVVSGESTRLWLLSVVCVRACACVCVYYCELCVLSRVHNPKSVQLPAQPLCCAATAELHIT